MLKSKYRLIFKEKTGTFFNNFSFLAYYLYWSLLNKTNIDRFTDLKTNERC